MLNSDLHNGGAGDLIIKKININTLDRIKADVIEMSLVCAKNLHYGTATTKQSFPCGR